MADKAVFLDRDRTLIEDPGYISDPSGVKLLPGVELALKSLMAGGFKTVVVTNQSAIARGLVTEEALGRIHAELRRQLADKGAHLDAIYYCPYHPEGTVEGYAIESELRKPSPGMLLKAAEEMDLDLSASWMVGDSARDIEAGQRAGCRTIRLRPATLATPGEVSQEDVQPDFTARNLVEAVRIILRESGYTATPAAPPVARAAGGPIGAPPTPPAAPVPVPRAATGQREMLGEILRYVRQVAHAEQEEFSVSKVFAGIVQVLALLGLLLALWRIATDQPVQAALWAQMATVFQVMALTLMMMKR